MHQSSTFTTSSTTRQSKSSKPEPTSTRDRNLNNAAKVSAVQFTDIPNPLPDTGVHPAPSPLPQTTAKSALTPSYTPVSDASSSSPSAALPTSMAAASTLMIFTYPTPTTSTQHTLSVSKPTYSPSLPPTPKQDPVEASPTELSLASSRPPQISTTIVALLAVGSAFLLLLIFLIIRACMKPKARSRPTPSLPIIDPDMKDSDQFAADIESSPLFGGKERFSERPASNFMWSQYDQPEPASIEPVQAATFGRVTAGVLHSFQPTQTQVEKTDYPFSGFSNSTQLHNGQTGPPSHPPPPPPPFPQVQAALTRAVSRISAASVSLYPGSPVSATNVGIAISGSAPATAFTADGHSVIHRAKSRPSLSRSRSHTAESRESRYLAYDGADVSSPPIPTRSQTIPCRLSMAPSMSNETGRSRVKSSYYAPGAYSRTSTGYPSSSKIDYSNVFDPPPLPPSMLHKSPSRRARETEALAAALGLPSPIVDHRPPSPQPTLYPDDSMSIRPSKPSHHRKPAAVPSSARSGLSAFPSPSLSPSLDTSAALGNLMLIDFTGTTKSMASLAASTSVKAGPAVHHSGSSRSMIPKSSSSRKNVARLTRSDDKPPSLPPLPSLSQMGLQNSNPEAYADYRSPTYSIYGLYESKRKSEAA